MYKLWSLFPINSPLILKQQTLLLSNVLVFMCKRNQPCLSGLNIHMLTKKYKNIDKSNASHFRMKIPIENAGHATINKPILEQWQNTAKAPTGLPLPIPQHAGLQKRSTVFNQRSHAHWVRHHGAHQNENCEKSQEMWKHGWIFWGQKHTWCTGV